MPDLRINRFDGGITDHYVDGPINQSRYLDNFLINRNGKAVVRPGWALCGDTAFNTNTGSSPIGGRIGSHYKIGRQDFDWLLEASLSGGVIARVISKVGKTFSTSSQIIDNEMLTTGAYQIHMLNFRNQTFIKPNNYTRPMKFYTSATGGSFQFNTAPNKLHTIGLPAYPDDPSFVHATGGSGANSYIYYFVYTRTYSVNDQVFLDISAPGTLQVTTGTEIGAGTSLNIQYTALLEDIATTGNLWGASNCEIQVYRTKVNQTVARRIDSLTVNAGSPPTSFVDNNPDSVLDAGATLYTSGGVQENDPAPYCKYMTIVNDIGWYANISDSYEGDNGETRPYQVRQSMPLDPDACPETFTVDLDDPITGISYVDRYPIVFTKNKCYRLEGNYTRRGGGAVVRRLVSESVGCICNRSIVQMEKGLFFMSIDGFYYSDGYKVQKLSHHLNERYKEIDIQNPDNNNFIGTYDNKTGRVYWLVYDADGNKIIYILDTFFGLRGSSTFTNAHTESVNITPGSLTVDHDGRLYISDESNEYSYYQEEGNTDDILPIVPWTVSITPGTWEVMAVPFRLVSNAYSFGSEAMRKLVTKFISAFRSTTDVAVAVSSINDANDSSKKGMKDIRDTASLGRTFVNAERRFPKGQMRCTYKQVVLETGRTPIYYSDVFPSPGADPYAKCNSDGTGANGGTRITLTNYPIYEWPDSGTSSELTTYYTMHLQLDNYKTAHKIYSVNAQYITLEENIGSFSNSNWELRRVAAGQELEIESFTIQYVPYGSGQDNYTTGDQPTGNA